jgi:hypothetical protein
LEDRSIIFIGQTLVVRYMRYRNSYPAQQYVDAATEAIRTRFLALARQLAERGEIVNYSHGHFLADPYSEIFELKPRDGRVLGFFHGRNFYVVHGAKKKNAKAQNSDYEIAEQLRQDFFSRLRKAKKGVRR